MIVEQAISKIRWGDSEQDVLEWLRDSKGILHEQAEAIVRKATSEKNKSVRVQAIMHLIGSLLILIGSIVFVSLQLLGRFVVLGIGTVIIAVLGVLSIYWTVRSIKRLLTGTRSGPIDL